MNSIWYLYIVRCNDGSLYTGITTDVERRIIEHQEQGKLCAKYLRGKSPIKLVYSKKIGSKSSAAKLEAQIKGWSKAEKERFIK